MWYVLYFHTVMVMLLVIKSGVVWLSYSGVKCLLLLIELSACNQQVDPHCTFHYVASLEADALFYILAHRVKQ